jgi:hypothetical protein
VTSYSANYLMASMRTRCLVLPKVSAARLDNSVMLPGSPESPSIDVPTIAIVGLAEAASLVTSPTADMSALSLIIGEFLKSALEIGPYIVCPFISSSSFPKELSAVLKNLLATLPIALLAYLQAKKKFEKLLGDVVAALDRVLPLLLILAIAVAVLILFGPALLP